MPVVDPKIFDRRPRMDNKPGYQEMVPTKMTYKEEDRTDIRVYRVKVYGPDGTLERTYMQDTMGVPFVDLKDVPDDLEYLARLRGSQKEQR